MLVVLMRWTIALSSSMMVTAGNFAGTSTYSPDTNTSYFSRSAVATVEKTIDSTSIMTSTPPLQPSTGFLS